MSTYQNQLYLQLISRLKLELKKDRINQHQIGKCLGVKQSAVSSLLSGKTRMTLDQFFSLCELIHIPPNRVLLETQENLAQTRPITLEIANTLYQSSTHLIAYCAATRPTLPSEIVTQGITLADAELAFNDLLEMNLLTKKDNHFIQTQLHVKYIAKNLESLDAHKNVLAKSLAHYQRKYQDKQYMDHCFHCPVIDRFTYDQAKEIENLMGKVWSKIESFSRENHAKRYSYRGPMPLWNIHLMLMTPLEN